MGQQALAPWGMDRVSWQLGEDKREQLLSGPEGFMVGLLNDLYIFLVYFFMYCGDYLRVT